MNNNFDSPISPGVSTRPVFAPALKHTQVCWHPGNLAIRLLLLLVAFFISTSCDDAPKPTKTKPTKPAVATAHLVLYTSVDPAVVGTVIDRFVDQTGIRVSVVGDRDSQRSYALASELRTEKNDPKADVWWSGEIFHTILLAEEGLLQPYDSPASADVPAQFKDAGGRWAGTGLRARVMAIHQGVPVSDLVGLENLKAPEIKGKIGISRPMVGTTAGHLAALYTAWGEYRYRIFLQSLRDNDVKQLPGNEDVARQVADGTLYVGLTDSNAVESSIAGGGKLVAQFPDQRSIGTLAIPTTVGLVTGSRESDSGKKLIDYLLSIAVEQELIKSGYAGWTVRADTGNVKMMQINYTETAHAMQRAVMLADTVLAGKLVVE